MLIASWALAGFYLSLGPVLVRRIVGSRSLLLGGLAVLAMAGSGAVAVLVARERSARALMTSAGAAALVAGVGATLAAVGPRRAGAVFWWDDLVGDGLRDGFQGAIRTVLPLAAAHERAGVLSVLYVVSYLAMGLPAIAGGVGVVYGGGLVRTAVVYGVAVMGLAGVVVAAGWRGARKRQLTNAIVRIP